MKNKKGFTLIEIIVSISLLVLIGVAVGISLNKVFKNQEVKNYEEYVDKVKSAALLYANNRVDIINELNSNVSFKIILVKELIDNGYINKNIVNPQTKEAIGENELIRIYYNENSEMMVDYPYNKINEIYLYTMNYNVTYNSQDQNLCYLGINTSSLQLVNGNGANSGTLYIDKNIKAYMEDGSECKNINTNKIGTYKIRYEYTVDNKSLSASNEKKTAERTITVKPSKPLINKFNVKYENEDTTLPNFDMFKANMTLNVTDVNNLNLKYCLIGLTSEEKNENIDNFINRCKNNYEEIDGIKQIGEYWSDIKSDFFVNIDENIENNTTRYNIVRNFNIKDEYQKVSNYDKVYFYVFVKNDFEESSNKLNEYNNGEYLLMSRINFHLLFDDAAFNNIPKTANNVYSITEINNDTPYNEVINAHKEYERAYRDRYVLTGWSTSKNQNIVEYTSETTTKINGVLNLYAVWVIDNEPPTCSLKLAGGKIVADIKDNYGVKYYNWNSTYSGESSLTKSITLGKSTYYVKDYAGNEGLCSIEVKEKESYTYVESKQCPNNVPVPCGNDSWYPGSESGWAGDQCYRTEWIDCSETKTGTKCPDGYTEGSGKCYRQL